MSESDYDKILIEGLKEGNEKIFDYLFHLYYSGLYVYVKRYVDQSNVAEDIVQDFFVRLWDNRKQISINKSLKSYMFTSVRNSCFDYLRHCKVQQRNEDKLLERIKNLKEDNDFYIEKELREKIDEAINKLPPACREIFVMNRFDGMKPAEIAGIRNISVRTVETQIGKALRVLRNELSSYLPLSVIAVLLRGV